jgi:hypothetical protein
VPALGRPEPLDEPPSRPATDSAVVRAAHSAIRPLARAKLLDDPEPRAGAVPDPVAPIPRPAAQEKQTDRLPDPESIGPPAPRPGHAPPGPVVGTMLPGEIVSDGGACVPTLTDSGTFWERLRNPTGRLYGSVEFLLWAVKGQDTPALVTTSAPEVAQPLQGVLGQPTTAVLFGGGQLDPEVMAGGRFHLGYWFDCDCLWAVEADYFLLGKRSEGFFLDSAQSPVIARPFILRNADGSQQESAELVATPGTNPGDLFASRGSLSISAPVEFSGAEANLRGRLLCGCDYTLDGIAGYRYLRLREGLLFLEDIISLRDVPQAGIAAGDRIVVTDRFDTRNEFHGGQLGLIGEVRRGRWSLEGTVKVALGSVRQRVSIAGRATVTGTDGAVKSDFPGGLLALPSNSGTFSQDRFAVAPELGVKVGYQLTDTLRAYVGYNFLYLSSVLRPGDQIDRVLDVNQLPPGGGPAPPPPARPIVPFRTSDFWAQGLTVGLEWRY